MFFQGQEPRELSPPSRNPNTYLFKGSKAKALLVIYAVGNGRGCVEAAWGFLGFLGGVGGMECPSAVKDLEN